MHVWHIPVRYSDTDGNCLAAVHIDVSAVDGMSVQDIRNLVLDATSDFLDKVIGEEEP